MASRADNDWIAGDVEFTEGDTHFRVARKGEERARMRMPLAGRHNVLNALAAIAIADGRGVAREAIEEALADISRRRAAHAGARRESPA